MLNGKKEPLMDIADEIRKKYKNIDTICPGLIQDIRRLEKRYKKALSAMAQHNDGLMEMMKSQGSSRCSSRKDDTSRQNSRVTSRDIKDHEIPRKEPPLPPKHTFLQNQQKRKKDRSRSQERFHHHKTYVRIQQLPQEPQNPQRPINRYAYVSQQPIKTVYNRLR